MEKTPQQIDLERKLAERQRKIEEQETAKNLMDNLTKFLGVFGNEERINLLLQNVRCQHRTHQQDIGKLLLALIAHFANLPNFEYDGRNQSTVEICREIMDNTPSLKEFPTYKLPTI